MDNGERLLATMTPAEAAIRSHGRQLLERPSPPPSFAETLSAAAAVGDRFGLGVSWDGPTDDRINAWELTDDQIRRGVVLRGIGLGTTDEKIAANMWLQWYCYRMAAPLLASWTFHRRIPDVSASNVAFRFDAEGRPAFATLIEARGFALDGDAVSDFKLTYVQDLLGEIVRVLLEQHLLPVAERVKGLYRLGGTLVRGTVASQIGMALTAVDGHSRLPWERVAVDAMDLLNLTKPIIGGQGKSGDVVCIESDCRTGMTFRRGTCCLVYKIESREKCGGCPLRSDEDRAAVYAGRLAARPDWSFS